METLDCGVKLRGLSLAWDLSVRKDIHCWPAGILHQHEEKAQETQEETDDKRQPCFCAVIGNSEKNSSVDKLALGMGMNS